ncbi:MAG: Maf family protein [Gemmatimonadota bacterium]|nr:Maf family protein [Gemmatimonadota bacterium]MDE2872328.1 Maf family protein [Gemmatimonadota bacterium]
MTIADGVPVVLASASPRRADVLRMLGLRFRVVPADVEERIGAVESPHDYVERLSGEKVSEVLARCPGALVVGGDTVVVLDGRVFEKPAGPAEAVEMLASLTGRTHRVYSGLAVAANGKVESRVARAGVTFRPASRELIERYVETGEPLDKAGSYGIQGYGAALVDRIEGDYYTVVGLSVAALVSVLPRVGLEYRPGAIVPLAPPGEDGDP